MFGTSTVPTVSIAPLFALPVALQIGFFVALFIYTVYTGILFYHWNAYATSQSATRLTFLMYFLTTIPCIAIIGIMAFTV